jgi:NAD+ diphosphatase
VTAAEPGYAFRHPGLDRADELRSDEAALTQLWFDARILVVDVEGQARGCGDPESLRFPSAADLFPERPADAIFLGRGNGEQAWFALPATALIDVPEHACDLRSAASQWPAFEASVFAQARALLHWRTRNKFCGACGVPLEARRGGHMLLCPGCGLEHYPRTDPAIIVAVSDGERLLLGRQASWSAGRWSVLAGFMEPGESLEQTVAREVFEEAGVRIRSASYAASQPWPFPSALMVGFRAEADPQPAQAGAELEAAQWFSAAELHAQIASGAIIRSPRMSISRWLIDDWLAQH